MIFVKNIAELIKDDFLIAGGKGASLGEMLRMGFPVPPGFVILSTAFDKFLIETDIIVEIDAQLKKVDVKKTNTINDASEVIRQLMNSCEVPRVLEREIFSAFSALKIKYAAVRSSAIAEDSSAASWAGELESYLGIQKKDLICYIKQCWSSLFAPRAIFYRLWRKMKNKENSVAVIVQNLVNAEVAGVCFTTHPVTQDRDQLVIEAGWGLGESVVSGKITPDTYIVDKSRMEILDVNRNRQFKQVAKAGSQIQEILVPKLKIGRQCLSDKKILQIAKIASKIEWHYGFPCDIEWALEKGKFYIVQSRPITTLGFK